jgi:hypothetical protein
VTEGTNQASGLSVIGRLRWRARSRLIRSASALTLRHCQSANCRCSTDQQDLTAQRDALIALGVTPERIYVDHGLTGTNRDRPGLRDAGEHRR